MSRDPDIAPAAVILFLKEIGLEADLRGQLVASARIDLQSVMGQKLQAVRQAPQAINLHIIVANRIIGPGGCSRWNIAVQDNRDLARGGALGGHCPQRSVDPAGGGGAVDGVRARQVEGPYCSVGTIGAKNRPSARERVDFLGEPRGTSATSQDSLQLITGGEEEAMARWLGASPEITNVAELPPR